MRISLATNFDDSLPARVAPYGVFELYGKLPADDVGGGRATFMLGRTSRRDLERHVAACRRAGLAFNYLLNATCLDNLEYTRAGQRRIRRLLDWLGGIGVSSVTVANPFLLRLIKAGYPGFEVRVSVFAAINDVQRLRHWEELGADRIALDSLQINREFELLRKMQAAVRCRLELLASNSCMRSCPLQPYHPNLLSHASQSGHRAGRLTIDWCLLWCSYMKIRDPVNYVRADWIRPEDISHYETIGYDDFKLTERSAPTEILVLRARAYHERRYDGNLLDLVQPYGFAVPEQAERRGPGWVARHFLRPGGIRWRKLPLLYRLARRRGLLGGAPGRPPVYVDNNALDGFIERFLRKGCRDRDCETCRYCHKWARKAVRIDESWRSECLALYRRAFEEMESGRLWGSSLARGVGAIARRSRLRLSDYVMAGYNAILAGAWSTLLGQVGYARWLFAAHAGAVALPWLLAQQGDRLSRVVRTLREIYPLLWLLALWTELDFLRELLHASANDGAIAGLDRAIFGINLDAVWVRHMPALWLSELMHLLYFAYYPAMLFPLLFVLMAGRTAALREMTFRLTLTYVGCYLIYLAFPVDGPHFLRPRYEGLFGNGFFYQLVRGMQEAGDSMGCSFPSSHVAGVVTMAYLAKRWLGPRVALLMAAIAAGVCVSAVYTQNHYAIDVAVGLVWALGLQLVVAPALLRWMEPGPVVRAAG